MNPKTLLILLCLLVLQRVGAQRPNLLFVFTDQQSYDMVGYHEGSWKERQKNYIDRPIDLLQKHD